MWNIKPSKKRDSKKVAADLRKAINGDPLVEASVSGIDLSTCTTEQLKAIWKIHEINDSDLSKEEKDKQIEDAYKMAFGVVPITGMRITGSGDDIVVERKAFTWFGGNSNPSSEGKPSWFREDNGTELAGVIEPKPEPRNPIKRLWNAITGDSGHGDEVEQVSATSCVRTQQTGKEMLQQKLEEMESQFEADLIKRNKAKAWNRIQDSLNKDVW